MKREYFHKRPTRRILNFLFIFPFFLGLRPLFVNYRLLDTLIYLIGMLLILLLIIYNNTIPYIIYDDISLKILLSYREEREEHRFDSMLGFTLYGKRRIVLYSYDHKPLKIILKREDRNRFTKLLKGNNINESPKEGLISK